MQKAQVAISCPQVWFKNRRAKLKHQNPANHAANPQSTTEEADPPKLVQTPQSSGQSENPSSPTSTVEASDTPGNLWPIAGGVDIVPPIKVINY